MGHDYGGSVALDNLCPWEEKDFDSDIDDEGIDLKLKYIEADPFRLPNLGKLIQGANPAKLKRQNPEIIGPTLNRQRPGTQQAAMTNGMIPN